MSKNDLEISRRKALAGLGVVGVGSAGAGLGTTAYFNDQEEYEDNTITAGEFGLTVNPGNMRVAQDRRSQHHKWGEYDGENDDDETFVGGSINIFDLKPGDELKFCWEVTVQHNPGYVELSAEDVKHLDGSKAEADVDPDDIEGLETLEDNIDERAEIAVYEGTSYASQIPFWYEEFDNFGKLLEALEAGLVLEDGDGNRLQLDADGEGVVVCIYLDISTDVGNEIQGAETSWDLVFHAEQARHNDEFGEN